MRVAVLPVALIACAAVVPGASAQEAPICLKVTERLRDGVDHWHGTNRRDRVSGLRGRDRMDGRRGNDRLNGGRDNDTVKGGQGNDLICGGRGSDKMIGGPGNDVIFGEEENDRIYPGPGNDRVLGSAGNDRIFGWGESHGQIVDDGVDILNGGYNDDVIEAGGADTLLGFTHNDILRTKTPLIAPKLMDGGGSKDRLYGSEEDDYMTGGRGKDGGDHVYGMGGDDKLSGGRRGRDNLNGGAGDDRLFGHSNLDFLDGGPDDDYCNIGSDGGVAQSCERVWPPFSRLFPRK